MIIFSPAVGAQDDPSWAVRSAVDELIAKNALFTPGRDGFSKGADGRLAQFELPEKTYTRDGKNWQIEIFCRRWRNAEDIGWQRWNNPSPEAGNLRIGSIRVELLLSGVKASWNDHVYFFEGRTAPSQGEVNRHLDTTALGNSSRSTVRQTPFTTGPTPERQSTAEDAAISSGRGIFRMMPNGQLQQMTPQAAVPVPVPAPAPAMRAPMPPLPSAPSNPYFGPPPSTLTTSAPASSPPVIFSGESKHSFGGIVLLTLMTIVVSAGLGYFWMKAKNDKQPIRQTQAPAAFPKPAFASIPDASTSDALSPTLSNLMNPEERSFFKMLQLVVGSSCRITPKARLCDLLDSTHSAAQNALMVPSSDAHIDFIITSHTSTQILCAIALDESTRACTERLKSERFINDLFASKQVALLRMPVSWAYNPDGIRSALTKAGLVL